MFLLILIILIVVAIIYYYYESSNVLPDFDKTEDLKQGLQQIRDHVDKRINMIQKDISDRLTKIEKDLTGELSNIRSNTTSLRMSSDRHTQYIYGKINEVQTVARTNSSNIRHLSDFIQSSKI